MKINKVILKEEKYYCVDLTKSSYVGIKKVGDSILKISDRVNIIKDTLDIKGRNIDTFRYVTDMNQNEIMIVDQENKIVSFNEKMYFFSQIETRARWVKNPQDFKPIQLDERIHKLANNVYGLNADLFLKKEAIRFAEARKLKSFDVVFSTERNTGKTSLVNLITKMYMPAGSEGNYHTLFSTPPKSNGRSIFHAGSIEEKSMTMLFDEIGIDYPQFTFLKEVQSPNGTQMEKKYSRAGIINPWAIYAYVLKNYSDDIRDIYYASDKSLLTSMFFSFNEKAIDVVELFPSQNDRDWLFDSAEAVEHLRNYLLGLYNTMTDEEKKSIRQSSSFVAQSHYDIANYLQKAPLTRSQMAVNYVKAIEEGNLKDLLFLFEDGGLIKELEVSKRKRKTFTMLSEQLNNIVFSQRCNAKDKLSLTLELHRKICDFLGLRAYEYRNYFEGLNSSSKLKLAS